jgi:hypothetical protein
MPNLTESTKFADVESLKIRRADIEDLNIISSLAIATCYEAYFELDPSKDLAD